MHVGSAFVPVLVALVAAALAARLGGSAVRRFSPPKPLWAAGLLTFAVAAAAEAYGEADGWGASGFRVYYLAGGCLTVALLGTGSAWAALPRDVALIVTGATLALGAAAVVGVLVAEIDVAVLRAATGEHPPANDALTGHAFLFAIVLNSVGSLLVIGSAALSIVRGRRRLANVLVIAGTIAVAGSGTLTRLGSYEFVYAGQIAGVVLLASGFERASRTADTRAERPRGLGVSAARSDPTPS